MPNKPMSLGAPGTQTMTNAQGNVMGVAPLDSAGNPTTFAAGILPIYTVAPGTAVTLGPPDPTGLTQAVQGVPGQVGTEVVTCTYANADGTVASTTDTYTIVAAIDDVAGFNVTNSPPA